MNKPCYTLITGASEGFGKALALECASRNMNLVLVALPASGLASLASFIQKNYAVDVNFFEHDLTRKEECLQLYNEVKEKNLAIRILINNAGMGGTHFFNERNADFYRRQIELNVLAPTLLTHYFLEALQNNTPSFILNVSSLAGFFYLPKKQVYGGTKSYLVAFSKSLGRELKGKNIFVSTVCPGGMNTTPLLTLQNRSLTGLGRWSVMNPDEVASIAIDGMLNKKEIIIPGFWNGLFILLDKMLPGFIKERIACKQMRDIKAYTNPLSTNFNHFNNIYDQQPKTGFMRKISTWARSHKTAARIFIITSFILLTMLAVFTGISLGEMRFSFSSAFVPVVSMIFLLTLACYPTRTMKEKISAPALFLRRKSCDFIMAASAFCLVAAISNQPDQYLNFYSRLNASSASPGFPKDSAVSKYKSIEAFAASMKDREGKTLKWKERKKLLKQQIKDIKKSGEPGPAGKILLVILSVLVALGLIYLVAALACGIACSGAETAAILVAIGGTAAVILLLILTIRAIYGKRRRKKEFQRKEGTG